MRILIAIESETLCDIVSFRCELLGHDVAIAVGSNLAADLIQHEPDVVLLDTEGGTELRDNLCAIRSYRQANNSTIRVMCISAQSNLEHVELAFKHGAEEYLLTPFNLQCLQDKIDRLTVETPA